MIKMFGKKRLQKERQKAIGKIMEKLDALEYSLDSDCRTGIPTHKFKVAKRDAKEIYTVANEFSALFYVVAINVTDNPKYSTVEIADR